LCCAARALFSRGHAYCGQTEAETLQEELAFRTRQADLDDKALKTLRAELTASEEAHRVRRATTPQ
jgi:hypothetical protein